MKIALSFLILMISLQSCTNRKQRDVRKLNWYEITAEARNKEVTVLVTDKTLSQWNSFYATFKDSLQLQFSITILFKGMELQAISDSLENFSTHDLVLCSGRDLENYLNQQLLFGPFDKLLPYSKTDFSKTDAFRFSDGIATKGFAVPINNIKLDSVNCAFLGIPIKTKKQAAAIVVLDAMLHAAEKAVLSPPNE
jgi:hypothetical protein